LDCIARRRLRLYHALVALGVQPQVHYMPIPWQPYWKGPARIGSGPWPGAGAFYASCLSLPLFPAMTDDEMSHTLRALCAAVGVLDETT